MQTKPKSRWTTVGYQLLSILAALIFTTIVMLLAGAPPFKAFEQLIYGSFGSVGNISDVFLAWAPLLITTAGLLVTFTAGLWNIGIEGQIALGAIFTTWVLRTLQDSTLAPGLIIALSILAGIVGGILWASLAGALKTFGGVNEIFGGLGLNFIANTLILWLIYGPWGRPGVASLSGTEIFPPRLSLQTLTNLSVSPWSLLLAVVSIVLIFILLKNTYIGLRLKAVGKNIRSSFNIGIPTWQYMMLSFVICGAFAGLAGALQVTAVYHRLLPYITGGYGFLGLLLAMLVNYQAIWVAPIALFYAALNIGSVQLPIALQLELVTLRRSARHAGAVRLAG